MSLKQTRTEGRKEDLENTAYILKIEEDGRKKKDQENISFKQTRTEGRRKTEECVLGAEEEAGRKEDQENMSLNKREWLS
jgi:hypothetical protein